MIAVLYRRSPLRYKQRTDLVQSWCDALWSTHSVCDQRKTHTQWKLSGIVCICFPL